MCTPDDLRDLDTTRIRIVGLAARLTKATDPASDGFLGESGSETATWTQTIRDEANSVAQALDAFLASGCAGS
ncbi:MAG: hypothetical protein Q7T14_10430, partial [Aestuariivirga sp.]|nr:hypothetical protein [Aestuariivirga sp.]